MIEKIFAVLTTFTNESQDAVTGKARELGFDPDRGRVPLQESFMNLSTSRDILMDAIEKKKLIQLPLTVQEEVLGDVSEIQRAQSSLLSGNDEVVNLVNAIEKLFTAIWQYGFHNLSEEVLGYQRKLNQLKNEQLEIRKVRKDLEEAIPYKKSIEKIHAAITELQATLQAKINEATEEEEKIAQLLKEATDGENKVSALLASVQQHESSSNQLLATTRSDNTAVSAARQSINEFEQEIDEYKEKLHDAVDKANSTVAENNSKTEALISVLAELEQKIKEQIQRATGHSLFHSFQTRQEALVGAKNRWIIALICLVIASLGLTGYLAHSTHDLSVGFWLKLSLTIPLIYAITFCSLQYARERRLEEEYAFKSNISISLIPYSELIGKLVNANEPKDKERYTTFMIEAVERVFSSPTAAVFDSEHSRKRAASDNLKPLTDSLKQISEAVAPIVKAVK